MQKPTKEFIEKEAADIWNDVNWKDRQFIFLKKNSDQSGGQMRRSLNYNADDQDFDPKAENKQAMRWPLCLQARVWGMLSSLGLG